MLDFSSRRKVHKRFFMDGKDACKEIHKRVLAEDSARCSYCMETKSFDIKECIAKNIPKEEWTGVGPLSNETISWYGYMDKSRNGKRDHHIKHIWKQDIICCTTCGCFWYTRPYPLMIRDKKDYHNVVQMLFGNH